ncbi:MAG: helix-turn-helix domain-containing protein [Bdellovibrionales bacterium]|nr:helix-turn-helix domain-containing protein [Bdellovibrionales bacterium]
MKPRSTQKKTSVKRTRYKNVGFLKALGESCRRLRIQRGYSIDRLAKESDQLSPSTIDRLEKGTGDSQILVLLRYAEVLGVSLLELLSFLKDSPELQKDSRILPYEENMRPPLGFVPVYPIQAVAGKFSVAEIIEEKPVGWIDTNIRGSTKDYFACMVRGESMLPKIADGAICLFRFYSGGTRQGRIFLIKARGLQDTESGESFVVKRYMRQTPLRSEAEETPAVIHLVSENPRFPPIVLVGLSDDEIQTVAEFIRVL